MTEASYSVPLAGDSRESHADWLEICALRERTMPVSLRDFARDLGIGGSVDAIDDYHEALDIDFDEDDLYESIAEDAFAELEERFRACSGTYPFTIKTNVLRSHRGTTRRVYTFLTLLSKFGKDGGPTEIKAAQLFEDLCAIALKSYLGSKQSKAHVFGFPRRLLPANFRSALTELCKELGEGEGAAEQPSTDDQKDAKLDVVAWAEFADLRPGKLIVFGQCATGKNWRNKIDELGDTEAWCRHWMIKSPTVLPMRAFFVPHRVEEKYWTHTCTFGGILFDRCRIAQCIPRLGQDLVDRCTSWSNHVIRTRL